MINTIFTQISYRNWIKDWIKSKGYTQNKFSEKFPAAVSSYAVLMSILNGNRNPTLPNFLKLFSPMKLKDEEIFYLLILKLENEIDIYDEEQVAVKNYLKRMREKLIPFLRGDFERQIPASPTVASIVEAYQLLKSKHKERVDKTLITELSLQAGRQKNSKELQQVLRKLNAALKN